MSLLRTILRRQQPVFEGISGSWEIEAPRTRTGISISWEGLMISLTLVGEFEFGVGKSGLDEDLDASSS